MLAKKHRRNQAGPVWYMDIHYETAPLRDRYLAAQERYPHLSLFVLTSNCRFSERHRGFLFYLHVEEKERSPCCWRPADPLFSHNFPFISSLFRSNNKNGEGENAITGFIKPAVYQPPWLFRQSNIDLGSSMNSSWCWAYSEQCCRPSCNVWSRRGGGYNTHFPVAVREIFNPALHTLMPFWDACCDWCGSSTCAELQYATGYLTSPFFTSAFLSLCIHRRRPGTFWLSSRLLLHGFVCF